MSSIQNVQNVPISQGRVDNSALPVWRLVLSRELADLWIGGKALSLLLFYSILLGIMAYIYSFNAQLDLIPPREAVSEMLRHAMAVSTFMGLIIGADSLSGERERGTLESLLVTPASRRHIVVAKLLAGISTWPAAYIIAVPYLYLLAQGDNVLGPALFWGAISGTVLVLGYTGLGMLISFWSSSNKASYFVSLSIYALLLIPAELPGDTVEAVGNFIQWINPMTATNRFLAKHLVDYGMLSEFWVWLISSAALAVLSVVLLLGYASSGLRLEPGTRLMFLAKWRRIKRPFLVMSLIFVSFFALSAYAFRGNQAEEFTITFESAAQQAKIGDKVEVGTIVKNNTSEASPPLIVAMNIVNLDEAGEVVDPEDWSPERTQYIATLAAGESAELDWIVNPILEGDFLVYLVLIPEPVGAETTSHASASADLHLTVRPMTDLKARSILPLVIGEPVLLLVITYFVYRHRRQQIDMGGSS